LVKFLECGDVQQGFARAGCPECACEILCGFLLPGMVGAIQTCGQLIHWHPHIRALVSGGVFQPEGRRMPSPPLASELFLKP
jgi:hypothetical protein